MIKINANKLDAMYLRNDEFNEQKEKMQRIFDNLVKQYGVSECKQLDNFACDCGRTRYRPTHITIGIDRVYYTPICPRCKKAMYQPEKLLQRYSGKRFIQSVLEACDDIDELRELSTAILMGFTTTLRYYLNANPEKALKARDIYRRKDMTEFIREYY